MHAGEIGGPEEIRQAIELLGAERIGHGIAAVRDPSLMDLLAHRRIPLEICPQSNIRTGALAKQLGLPAAQIEQHPLPQLFRHGIPVVLSTDDPAMFHTNLRSEYENALRMGLQEAELKRLAKMSFEYAFIDDNAKVALQRRWESHIRIEIICAQPSVASGQRRKCYNRRMKAHVWVMPKRTVLDPQGQTIQHALAGLGYGRSEGRPAGEIFCAGSRRLDAAKRPKANLSASRKMY